MTKLATIEIDAAPANVSAMMDRGQFHSHQDGAWRYSPYGGETVYVNDPTAQFDSAAVFAGGRGASVCVDGGLVAFIHRDGTRGLRRWDERQHALLWQLYAPTDDGERQLRAWVQEQFSKITA